jgi:radical SAM-linked protein
VSRRPKPGPPREQLPIAQRLRLQYRRTGRMRFVSHRDFQRALERAVRRAEIPIAYSQGFSPHPKISYANAAPTGAESAAEYLEISVTATCEPEAVRAALDSALPDDLGIVRVVAAEGPALPSLLEASLWELRVPGVTHDQAQAAVNVLLGLETAVTVRRTAKGRREVDVRAALVSLAARRGLTCGESTDGPPCAILRAVVRHGTPNVRPDDILAALRDHAGLDVGPSATMHRLAQGPLDSDAGTVGDPFVPRQAPPASRPERTSVRPA